MKFVVSGGVAGLHETADNEDHHV